MVLAVICDGGAGTRAKLRRGRKSDKLFLTEIFRGDEEFSERKNAAER